MEKEIVALRFTKITIMVLLLWARPVMAQIAIAPMDETLNVGVNASCSDSIGNLYVLHAVKGIGYEVGEFEVRKWNGLFWQSLPKLPVYGFVFSDQNRISLAFFKNKLCVAGSFKAANGIQGVATFNGATWETLGSGIQSNYVIHEDISIPHLLTFDDTLFASGDFKVDDGKSIRNFAKLKNGVWTGIDLQNGTLTGLQQLNDSLFIGGSFSSVEGVSANHLARYHNGSWEAIPNNFNVPILGLSQFNGQLVVITQNGFYQRVSGNWIRISDVGMDVIKFSSALEQNGKLYAVGDFIDQDRSNYSLISIDLDSTNSLVKTNSIQFSGYRELSLEKSASGLVYVIGAFSKFGASGLKNIATFKPGYTIVSGYVFLDNNNNCQFDAGDEAQSNVVLSLNNNKEYTSTNAQGFYQFFVRSNETATIKVFPSAQYQASCAGAERLVAGNGTDRKESVSFSMEIKPNFVSNYKFWSASGNVVKHGFTGYYEIDLSEIGLDQYPIQVVLEHDERLKQFTTSAHYKCAYHGRMVWELEKPTPIKLSFEIDPTTIQMGDSLLFKSVVSELNGEWFQNQTIKQEVVSAYDPNDKQCDADELDVKTESLSYHVRFQNLGTAEATDVHVVDTIDANMPIEFIRIIGNSHFNQFATAYKVRGRAIIWSFEGINLGANQHVGEEESSGFVTFKTGLGKNLKVGQEIHNTAYIYFDFQPPVVTNTTISKVVEPQKEKPNLGSTFKVFPNPASDQISISSPLEPISQIEVFSTDGRLVKTQNIAQPSLLVNLGVEDLPFGMYVVKVRHQLGFSSLPLIIR